MARTAKHVLNTTLLAGALLASASLMQACSEDSDPGRCYTTGEFSTRLVNRDYAVQICIDWVHLLLSNCVQIYGLSLNPSPEEIGAYCGTAVRREYVSSDDGYGAYGDEHQHAYQIQHTCNFIDNPSFACRQFAPSAETADQESPEQDLAQNEAAKNLGNLIIGKAGQAVSLKPVSKSLTGAAIPQATGPGYRATVVLHGQSTSTGDAL